VQKPPFAKPPTFGHSDLSALVPKAAIVCDGPHRTLTAFIPAELKLTDATLASLANCVLDLGPDELVDSGYVKRFRQRQREEAETRGNQR